MAVVAPQEFKAEVLSDRLIGYASQVSSHESVPAMTFADSSMNALQGSELERVVNNTGYSVRQSLGADAAIHVFTLNTTLFPNSSNAWDSLAETYDVRGDKEMAKVLYDKAHQLSSYGSNNK